MRRFEGARLDRVEVNTIERNSKLIADSPRSTKLDTMIELLDIMVELHFTGQCGSVSMDDINNHAAQMGPFKSDDDFVNYVNEMNAASLTKLDIAYESYFTGK